MSAVACEKDLLYMLPFPQEGDTPPQYIPSLCIPPPYSLDWALAWALTWARSESQIRRERRARFILSSVGGLGSERTILPPLRDARRFPRLTQQWASKGGSEGGRRESTWPSTPPVPPPRDCTVINQLFGER